VKEFLTGGLRSRIAKIMWNNRMFISLEGSEDMKIDEFSGYSYRQKKDVTEDFMGHNSQK